MPRYVYSLTEGRAHDIRFVADEYVKQDGELEGEDETLPNSDELSTAPLPRKVLKSVILSRISDEQLDAALAAMTTRQKERWRSPDTPSVFVDDPEIIGMITAIGADPAVVLAP